MHVAFPERWCRSWPLQPLLSRWCRSQFPCPLLSRWCRSRSPCPLLRRWCRSVPLHHSWNDWALCIKQNFGTWGATGKGILLVPFLSQMLGGAISRQQCSWAQRSPRRACPFSPVVSSLRVGGAEAAGVLPWPDAAMGNWALPPPPMEEPLKFCREPRWTHSPAPWWGSVKSWGRSCESYLCLLMNRSGLPHQLLCGVSMLELIPGTNKGHSSLNCRISNILIRRCTKQDKTWWKWCSTD